jgi:ketosteroid isomerase-like protein
MDQAMSENLDLVRAICGAWERGDYSSADWADPEIEYVKADDFEPGTWKGRAAMNEAWRGFASAWEDRELDDERVLVLLGFSGRGKASGIEAAQLRIKVAHVMYVRAGRVVKLVLYSDREQAFADLGVAPPAA